MSLGPVLGFGGGCEAVEIACTFLGRYLLVLLLGGVCFFLIYESIKFTFCKQTCTK